MAVPELKHPVVMDITFGGMFYAIVNTDLVDELPKLVPENGRRIAYLGSKILVWFFNEIMSFAYRCFQRKYEVILVSSNYYNRKLRNNRILYATPQT